MRNRSVVIIVVLVLLWAGATAPAWADPLRDAQGKFPVDHPPQRVVSLVPAATEMLVAVGAGDALIGVTSHDILPVSQGKKEVVGGFALPSLERIEALHPDLILVSNLHGKVKKRFQDQCAVVELVPVHSVEQALERLNDLGTLLGRGKEANALAAGIREELALIRAKVEPIPTGKRQRVMRLMGQTPLMTPGDDSFQNDFIRIAGGIPPHFGKNGEAIVVSPAEIIRFNPQVIYVCGDSAAEAVLANPALQKVDAVKHKRVFSFPCDFTCRAGINMGGFVSWLAARVYEQEFSDPSHQAYPDQMLDTRPVALPLPYVRQALVQKSRVRDFINKTLVVDFTKPQRILSTLEGMREGVMSVGNHYYPPPSWGLGHTSGLDGLRQMVTATLVRPAALTSLLFTGADMDHLVVVEKSFRGLTVYALVTAGVKTNAMRMAKDSGNFYEPGTINILLLTNTRLSEQAMSRAIITATEAKSAALTDLDIRSTYSPNYAATGTGTDNLLVVQGEGPGIDGAGGHTKMGELIAAAVYDGVRQAIAGQNRITAGRSIFARLEERRINLASLLPAEPEECSMNRQHLVAAVEDALMQPEYAGFMAGSLAMSDAAQAGLADPRGHESWAKAVAARLAGRAVEPWQERFPEGQLPPLVAKALEALVNGVCAREKGSVD
ncbi:MAG: helical backbone metal receptor [Deltaproteobacteria bacterium]|nr:helical backbone metal receptor [Deltaproteobacteria bacterium]